jgi:SNF2 family DNA or RNA helicase
MRFSPRPYQTAAFERLLLSPYHLLALRMGTGKTAIALSAVEELTHNRFEITKTLVVAPKRVAEMVWHSEAAKWDHIRELTVVRVLGSRKQRLQALSHTADIYVINRENFPWLVDHCGNSWPFDCVIIDENRGFKNRGSESWQALKKVRKAIKRLYLLTGTPTPNSLLDLWPQVSIMDLGKRLGPGITHFRDRYFVPDKRSGHIVYSWKLRPGAEDEIYDKVADVMMHVGGGIELPDRIDNTVPVTFDMVRYEELQREFVSGSITAANAAVLAGKLGQMANGAVYDEFGHVTEIHGAKLEALEEIVDQGEPVLCFTAYRHDQERIVKHFKGYRVEIFDGEPSLKRWQRGEIELLLMHPAAGGHGVDGLQLGGSVVVWFGLPFSLDLYEQANARIHRSGQAQKVVVHHIVAIETIDERILEVLATKGNMQQALLQAVTDIKGALTT